MEICVNILQRCMCGNLCQYFTEMYVWKFVSVFYRDVCVEICVCVLQRCMCGNLCQCFTDMYVWNLCQYFTEMYVWKFVSVFYRGMCRNLCQCFTEVYIVCESGFSDVLLSRFEVLFRNGLVMHIKVFQAETTMHYEC